MFCALPAELKQHFAISEWNGSSDRQKSQIFCLFYIIDRRVSHLRNADAYHQAKPERQRSCLSQ